MHSEANFPILSLENATLNTLYPHGHHNMNLKQALVTHLYS